MGSIKRFKQCIEYVRSEIASELQMHQLGLLLEIKAAEPKAIPFKVLEERLNISNAAISRNVQYLGTRMMRHGNGYVETGLGLVQSRQGPYNPRQFVVELTKRGRSLFRDMDKILKRAK